MLFELQHWFNQRIEKPSKIIIPLKPPAPQRAKPVAESTRGLRASFLTHQASLTDYHIRFFFFPSLHPFLYLHDYSILLHSLPICRQVPLQKPGSQVRQPGSLVYFYCFMKRFLSIEEFSLSCFLLSKWKCLKITAFFPLLPPSFPPLIPQVKCKAKTKPPAMGIIAQLEGSHSWDFSHQVHNCAEPQSNFNPWL